MGGLGGLPATDKKFGSVLQSTVTEMYRSGLDKHDKLPTLRYLGVMPIVAFAATQSLVKVMAVNKSRPASPVSTEPPLLSDTGQHGFGEEANPDHVLSKVINSPMLLSGTANLNWLHST